MGRTRRGVRAAIGRRLVRLERGVIRAALTPVIAFADRRIARSLARNV
jgi:hypothetical protein